VESDRYLWDKTGEPDPELQRWESLLSRFAPTEIPPLKQPVSHRRYYWLAAAAGLVISVLAVCAFWQPGPSWRVTTLSGTPTIEGRPKTNITVGQLLETDKLSRAKLHLGLLGAIEVAPNTRLRLVATRDGHHRLALERGQIAARLWAPSRTLSVETPSSTAIDLGCAFILQVDEKGNGMVRVTSGWVQFQFADQQAIVPAGAIALTKPGLGPGTPFFEDATAEFRAALQRLDFGPNRYQDPQSLAIVLSQARPKDAITLLSLFARLNPTNRGPLFDRAAQFIPPPAGLTREQAIAATNQPAMDQWWKKLGLGDAKNWIVNWRDALTSLR
jgi:hypothetical protein